MKKDIFFETLSKDELVFIKGGNQNSSSSYSAVVDPETDDDDDRETENERESISLPSDILLNDKNTIKL
ncbi:hypothetical protein [Tenacibaculum sp. 190524A05c]|uniref:hypothetical protein n=1 Tax=Tenacibaculum platacis TaxID=3137852 RepID=UPI0032B1026C